MTNQVSQEPAEVHDEPVAKRAYRKPEVTLFGSVEEFTRGTGTSALDAGKVSRKG